MFNALFSEESNAEKSTEPKAEENAGEASTSSAASPLLNLWSVAAAVTNTVKARADELVKSVVDTDWQTELSQFSREVGEESKTLKEKTAELVEHLPEQVVHLPEKAEEALHHLPTQVQLPKDVGQTLEGVSVAFAQFGKTLLQGTKELIDELKEGVETEMAAASREGKRAGRAKATATSSAKLASVTAKYNRFEAEVAAMQRDSSTYCDEPEDAEDYARWKAGFNLDSVKADISRILSDNAFMAELQSRLVPIIVEHEDFWHRYFYRLSKLQQKEEQRQQLAQRAKTLQEDDVPLGWGDEDEAPPSPRANEGQRASTADAAAAEPAAVSSPTPSAQHTEPQAAASVSASAPSELSPPVVKPASTSEDESKESKSSHVTATATFAAAAAAVVTSSASAATAGAAREPTVGTAAEPVGEDRKTQSGGGASTGSAGISSATSVAADGVHLESEPHMETASDSSAKEWCVVSSDAQQPATSSAAAAPAEAGSGLPGPQPEEGQASEPPADGEVPSNHSETAGPAPAQAAPPAANAATVSEGSSPAVEKAADAPKEAKGAAKPPTAAAEEELDEDWGNWD